MRFLGFHASAVLGALLLSGGTAAAQDKNPQNGLGYMPSLADLMAVTQLRHFKLWYAVKFENWELANYELVQMVASVRNAARLYPGNQAADSTSMDKPAELLGEAIRTKNSAKFDAAFNQMTSACNACHVATDRAYIVVRVPTRSPFSNQEFEPRRR